MRTASPITPVPRPATGTPSAGVRRVGIVGFWWALGYVPIHLYWALGAPSGWIGMNRPVPHWQTANWGACVVIVGAGLTSLALTRSWGAALPLGLRRGTAYVGGVVGIAHWAVFSVGSALQLAGALGYKTTGDQTVAELRRFGWLNVTLFEPWFAIMGVLLIVAARHAVVRWPAAQAEDSGPGAGLRRVGSLLAVTGIGTVVLGVFLFMPWLFAGAGPVLVVIGVAVGAGHIGVVPRRSA